MKSEKIERIKEKLKYRTPEILGLALVVTTATLTVIGMKLLEKDDFPKGKRTCMRLNDEDIQMMMEEDAVVLYHIHGREFGIHYYPEN